MYDWDYKCEIFDSKKYVEISNFTDNHAFFFFNSISKNILFSYKNTSY
ncbi:hypothetical protein PLEI_3720 [Photobacterium leiognathi lrivu.4.1]|uniref:Uncharacterized protein n=1 Tax=Photobacterium leiognathi lrivu.4.1 TaxID=1248232 RepID=V5H4S3_PHOLE|nr:hypothetical protein PLEI_3720 [Photobacterium leiognathi lrivu.4.1]